MTTRNDITGDKIQTKPATDAYRKGWDFMEQVKLAKEVIAEIIAEEKEVIYVDEIVGTNAYCDGVLQPKQEGVTYIVRKKFGPQCLDCQRAPKGKLCARCEEEA